MNQIFFIFTIFFLTLGPLKTIPVFYRATANRTPLFKWKVAVRSTFLSTIIVLMLAGLGRNIVVNWGVSAEALQIAAGLLLLIAAIKVLSQFSLPQKLKERLEAKADNESEVWEMSITPITIPAIITPYGVVAVLAIMSNAYGQHALEFTIVGFLLFIMFLNFIGMLFAEYAIHYLGLPSLLVLGWVVAAMQAALAIDVIIKAFIEIVRNNLLTS